MTLHTLYRDPFSLGSPYIQEMMPGLSLSQLASAIPFLPGNFADCGAIAVNGEVVPREYWECVRPKTGTVVTFHLAVAGGEGGGKQIFGLLAAIALSVATAGIAGGALAPLLGSSFAAGTLGASVLAGAVGLAGALALSALSSPPSIDASESTDSSSSLQPASIQGNVLDPNASIPRVIGSRRIFPPFAAEPVVELVGQDEIVEAVYVLAGPHTLDEFRLGDGSIESPANDTKDVELEYYEAKPGDIEPTLVVRQGRTSEQNLTLSVHTVDSENQDTLDSDVSDPLPVYHAVTTRNSPDENWIQFLLTGLMRQDDTTDSLRIPFRIRMRRRGDTTWRYLPEIHYQNVTQTQVRFQVKLLWGDPYTDDLVTPPASIGFTYATIYVPAQDVDPLGSVWYADPYFYDGVGDTWYNSANPDTSGLLNIGLYPEYVNIYLDESEWEPGIWDIEIKRGETIRDTLFTEATYDYDGDVLDFFGQITAGTLPLTRAGLLDTVNFVRMVNIWNELPVVDPSLARIEITAKNRAVRSLSCLASGYVRDLVSGQGPYFSAGSISPAYWSWDTPGAVTDVDALALVRPDTTQGIESADRPESLGICVRGSAAQDGYVLTFGSSGSGARDQLVLTKFVAGAPTELAVATFPWSLDKNYFLRLNATGSTIKGKAWSASLPEPDAWLFTTTDTDLVSGSVGIFMLENLSDGFVNWFSVGLSGDDAPNPPIIEPVYATDFSELTLGTELDDAVDWSYEFGATSSATITASANLPYNGEASEWTTFTTTSNPAPHFREVLTGSENFDPLPEELLDDAGLVDWRRRCAESDFTCDMVAEGLEIADLLRVVSATGYARLYRSEQWGVTLDKNRRNESPVQIFSPRNSRGFSWHKAFGRLPSGFRVSYDDVSNDYQTDQLEVYRSGARGSGARMEQVSYDGLVNRGDVIKRATFDLRQAESRSTFYSFDAPAESLVCRRGSLVGVVQDTLTRHYGYARVEDVYISEGSITGIKLDEKVQVYYEPDVLNTFDFLEVEDVLNLGIQTSLGIRTSSGDVTVHPLSTDSTTEYTDTLEFATPVRAQHSPASIYDDEPPLNIDVGDLVVFGLAGSEYKRLVVSEVQPTASLFARLTCVDEASNIFDDVFGVTY